MFGKFVFALIAVCCMAQGYEARNVSPSISADEVVEAIKQLIQKIIDALAELKQLILDLKDKIQNIINKLDLPGVIAKIRAEMDRIMKAAGTNPVLAMKCIRAGEKATENLKQEATKGLKKCMSEIENVENQIEALVKKLTNEADQIVADITAQANTCIKDHLVNPSELDECLRRYTCIYSVPTVTWEICLYE